MKPDLYRKAARAWHRCGPQDVSHRQTLGRNGDGLFVQRPWPDAVFGEPEMCPICLLVMHLPVKTHCKIERSLAETVAQSLEPCSTEPRAAQPGSAAKTHDRFLAQRKTDLMTQASTPKRRKSFQTEPYR
ncbi:hypothetical protein NPIL_236481 [Nephila pilipes]|uniref:Uncharacterized protein n=1 Tax=Nephila pilipes TaxID=299642 RepID=A0A8X6N7K7_NEPPI|nr:hypothetical protein NPIL_236481 [Nephila pilipes]